MNGILNIYKAPGITSRKCVNKVQHITGIRKAGHAGTLDPFAEGVLPICLGRGTKIVDYIRQGLKSYRATLRLDIITDTQDITGEVLREYEPPAKLPSSSDVQTALDGFIGTQEQRTPRYSARKVNGVRMYDLARRNEPIPERYKTICIHLVRTESYAYPEISFSLDCSEGTYVRMLGEDLGRTLNLGGTLTTLVRTRVSDFTLENTITLENLQEMLTETSLDTIMHPVHTGVSHLGRVELSGPGEYKFRHGVRMTVSDWTRIPADLAENEMLAAFSSDGIFLGLAGVVSRDDPAAIILKTTKLIDISRTW